MTAPQLFKIVNTDDAILHWVVKFPSGICVSESTANKIRIIFPSVSDMTGILCSDDLTVRMEEIK